MKKIKIAFRVLMGIPKSLYINFKLLPLNQAIRIPILVSSRTSLNLRGGVIINSKNVCFGMINIGILGDSDGILTEKSNYIGCDKQSRIVFEGKMCMAPGGSIKAMGGGIITLGNNLSFNSHCTLLCKKAITIGHNVMTGWNVLISDGDGHTIINELGEQVNKPDPVIVGNNVWLAANTTLLKGAFVNDGSIVAMGCIVTRHYEENNVIIAGIPSKIVKYNIIWHQ